MDLFSYIGTTILNHLLEPPKEQEQNYFDTVIESQQSAEILTGFERAVDQRITSLNRSSQSDLSIIKAHVRASRSGSCEASYASENDTKERTLLVDLRNTFKSRKNPVKLSDLSESLQRKGAVERLNLSPCNNKKEGQPYSLFCTSFSTSVTSKQLEKIVNKRLNTLNTLTPVIRTVEDIKRVTELISDEDVSERDTLRELSTLLREKRTAPTLKDLLAGNTSPKLSDEDLTMIKKHVITL